jgi:ABC-type nitrate/sulfonate/bicarbonate transport system substrate-binding protein
MPTRRSVMAGAAAAAVGTLGFPAIVRAAEKVTLITPFGFDSDFLDLMNAYSGGHFAKEGLDATVLGASGTVQHIQQVIAGQVDYGQFSGTDFIRAVGAKGAPLRAIATVRQNSGFHVVSLKDKPVKTGADLKGKTIGLLSYGGTTQTFIELLMAKAGLKKDDASLVVAGNNPGEVDLIRQGRIDCFICNYSVSYYLMHAKEPLEILDVDAVVPAPGRVFHATRETLDKRPELTLKVLRAIRASMQEMMANPIGPILERAMKDFEIPGVKDVAAAAAQAKDGITANWFADGKPDTLLRNLPERWQSGCDALRSVRFADVKDPGALYTNGFLDKI